MSTLNRNADLSKACFINPNTGEQECYLYPDSLPVEESNQRKADEWATFVNNNSFRGTYAKRGAKLVKKHAKGGLIPIHLNTPIRRKGAVEGPGTLGTITMKKEDSANNQEQARDRAEREYNLDHYGTAYPTNGAKVKARATLLLGNLGAMVRVPVKWGINWWNSSQILDKNKLAYDNRDKNSWDLGERLLGLKKGGVLFALEGRWIGDPKKAVWDYSKGPKDIQKKLARYYTNMKMNDEDYTSVQEYLQKNPKLADYLDKAYAKGIDWDTLGGNFLGNAQKIHYTNYRNSTGEARMTARVKSAYDALIKHLGYNNAADFEQTLKNAGYELYTDTTVGLKNKSDDTQLKIYLAEIPEKGVHYVDQDGRELDMSKKAMTPKVEAHQYYLKAQAKKLALHSKASNDWAKVGKSLDIPGEFYDRMIARGFTYDPKKGRYSKGNYEYFIQDGRLKRLDKEAGVEGLLTTRELKKLLNLK